MKRERPGRLVLLLTWLAVTGPAGLERPAPASARAAELTTIELTGKVLVKDTTRFGINLGGDAYYFEGTSYRRCHFGPGSAPDGAATWFGGGSDWDKILAGGRYTILSGPSKWTAGAIKEITTRQYRHEGRMKPLRTNFIAAGDAST